MPAFFARGPVASQEAIKLLSGDGGGFFNANSAHPFENPTALINLCEMLLIFLIGAALTHTFGRMVGDERQGWSLFGAMMVLFAVGLCVVYSAETSGNPHFANLDIDQAAGPAGFNNQGFSLFDAEPLFRASLPRPSPLESSAGTHASLRRR